MRKILFFLLAFALATNGLESKKTHDSPIQEVPELNRKPELGCGKKFINYFWKMVFTEPLFSEGSLGKLVLENWYLPAEGKQFSGNKGEELLRHHIFSFMSKEQRGELRPSCPYLNALIEDEWIDCLKDFSVEDVKKYLEKAIEYDYAPVVDVLLKREDLGHIIISAQDKYTGTLYECDGNPVTRDIEEIKKEKERVKKESLEFAEMFELAVKKGNKEIISLLLNDQRMRDALTYAYPYAFFRDGDSHSSSVNPFFKGRGKSDLVLSIIEKNCVIWMTKSDNKYLELFEVMFDTNEAAETFQDYWHILERLEGEVNGFSLEMPKIISVLNDFGHAHAYRDFDHDLEIREYTNRKVRSFVMDYSDDFAMAVHADEYGKKVTYLACKADEELPCTIDLSVATLLEYAAEKECVEAVEFLLKREDALGVTQQDKDKALFFALASDAKRILPLFDEKEDVDVLKQIETFLNKKDEYGITFDDILRLFFIALSETKQGKVKDCALLVFNRFKDEFVTYALQGNNFAAVLFSFAIFTKHDDIVQTLLDNEKSFNAIKPLISSGEMVFGSDGSALFDFVIARKQRFELTHENMFKALEYAALDNCCKQQVEILLENFNYTREQLEKILDGFYRDDQTVHEFRRLIEDAISKLEN